MIAATVLIGSGWVAAQTSPTREPAQDARIIAGAVGGMLGAAESGSLDAVLRSIVRGDLRVQAGPGPFAPEPAARMEGFGPSLRNLAYVVVLDPRGQTIASSDPAGAAFDPPERGEWRALQRAAPGGWWNPHELVSLRPEGQPVALGAYPVLDQRGRALATVVVAKSALPAPDRLMNLRRVVAIFSAATVAVLAGAFLFALASAALVGYVLSRRLTARLERLGRAAEGLAGGDLDQRVAAGPADEVGLLTRQFNHMADRLAVSVGELEAEKRSAEEALQTKRELVANVSHELRTPLSSIRGHTESLLMEAEGLGGRQREYLGVINREMERLGGLVDDLFLLSTTEAGALPLLLRNVAIAEVVAEALGAVEPIARGDRRVALVSRLPGDLPAVVADRQRVLQVLGNLLRNALRYTPEGGLISVRAERRDAVVEISIEDTGPGIPPDQVPHLFERFYRGDPARERATGGAGLGLAIVRELVEAMGGAVAAASVVGEGSRFSFTLPIAVDLELDKT